MPDVPATQLADSRTKQDQRFDDRSSRFDPALPALRIARAALARACGREPVLLRSGGSLPVLAAFSQRGLPAIVSGFGLPQDNFHAPDESFAIASLELGRRAAQALYEDLTALAVSG